ncbi:hypothetical protein PRZ03_17490 [Paucibacter sp. hw8]|uniref:Stereocilin n=1 Tax=Roseateles albus TaxID=2987525 RepID=A0ABT5KHG1_9BURK|nr:hypothetical protein [Roseateles albus]
MDTNTMPPQPPADLPPNFEPLDLPAEPVEPGDLPVQPDQGAMPTHIPGDPEASA